VGRKPDADHHQSCQRRLSELSRNALAGKLGIGPIRIGGDVTTGKTATNIDLLAARRVQLRINCALTERDRLGACPGG